MESFRLISEVIVYLHGNVIFISSPDDKTCLDKVKRKISAHGLCLSVCKELVVNSENFKLKLNNDFNIFTASEDLPGGLSKYYRVINLDMKGEYLAELFNFTKFNNGNWDETFELAIKDTDGSVRFYCPTMPGFNAASDEMIRRMNCKIFKKTRKFIPGHRYDTETSTIVYLGKFHTHENNTASDHYSSLPVTEAHFYIKNKKSATKVSEVFNNGVIVGSNGVVTIDDSFYEIYCSTSMKTMVDSGEVLENDFTCYEDYITQLLNNSTNISNISNRQGDNLFCTLSIFKYSEKADIVKHSDDILNKVRDFIKVNLNTCLTKYWDISTTCRYNIDPKTSIDTQAEELSSTFIVSINVLDSSSA